jgi:hypothetical protein
MSTYTYVEGNPLTGIDPDGTNAVWALYRAGGMGWKLGEEINPLIQPYIAAGLDALLLPDPMEEAVVLAQNNKQTRKRIDGLEKQIEVHKKKIDQEPECDAANHWREEVKIWESEIQRLRLRLPNGR